MAGALVYSVAVAVRSRGGTLAMTGRHRTGDGGGEVLVAQGLSGLEQSERAPARKTHVCGSTPSPAIASYPLSRLL
jgi:hypothetical protein